MSWKKIAAATLVSVVINFQLLANEKLTIAVGDWPPYLSKDLKHSGLIAHMISDIFISEGYKVDIIFLPWGRAYKEATLGKYDMTGVWMHKAEREADFYYSDPVLTEQFVFFHLKAYSFNWASLDDLHGIRMGGGFEFSYGPEFDTALKSGKLTMERVSTDKQNFTKLLLGRIQIYPQEVNVGYSSLRAHFPKEKVKKITHHHRQLLNNKSFVLFPKTLKKSQALRSSFNRRLQQLKDNSQYTTYFKAFHRGEYNDKH